MDDINAFAGKNIMLVCAETYSWPMHYVAERLRGVSGGVSAIYIQPSESYFDAPDYKSFKSMNPDVDIVDMSVVVDQYLKRHRSADSEIDWDYISYIEDTYTSYSALNEQLVSEMMLVTYCHDREYYPFVERSNILLYVQLYYKKIEEVFRNRTIDVILDCDVDFFGRSVLLEISKRHNVPYISIDYSRVGSYVLPTLSLVKKREKYFNKLFCEYVDDDILNDPGVEELYEMARCSSQKIPPLYHKMYESNKFSALKMLKKLIVKTVTSMNKVSFKQLKMNILDGVSSPICTKVVLRYKFMYLYFIRRFYLEYGRTFYRRDLSKIRYILVPLHVIPESSTSVMSPYYINEEFIIESLSKAVRSDQYVVVKEHWSMIGYRPLRFYKKIKKIPNVVLIDPTMYKTSGEYISQAELVVTVSGSTALEASFIGVNSMVLSNAVFGLLSSIKEISITPNLRKDISDQLGRKISTKELYAYLKIVLTWGAEVNIKELLVHPSRSDKESIKINIDNLIRVFINGLNIYDKNGEGT